MKKIYDIIYTLPVSILLTAACSFYMGIAENNIVGYIVGISCSLGIVLWKHLNKKKKIYCIGAVVVFLAGLFLVIGKEGSISWILTNNYLIWIICFSVISVCLGFFMQKNRYMRLIVAAVLLIAGVTIMIMQWKMPKAAFPCMSFIVLISLAEEIQNKWTKSGYTDQRLHVTMTSPILLLLCVCIWLVPASDKPYDWHIVKTIYQKVTCYVDQIVGALSHSSEEYGLVGFSTESTMVGELKQNDREVLYLSDASLYMKNTHLVGSMSSEFAGDRWIAETDVNETRERDIDTIETLCAIRKYDEEQCPDYYKRVTVKFENQYYNTRYLFLPSKMAIQKNQIYCVPYHEENGSFLSEKKLKKGDTYTVACYIINNYNPNFGKLIENAAKIQEHEWKSMETDLSYVEYLDYKQKIYDKYCKKDSVSSEVQTILDEVSADSENDYEKMKKLELYLKSFEYTVKPGNLPSRVKDGASFLDYFLLESKKGYCTHYASAFVLMARNMGLPARYVQGYYVHRDGEKETIVRQNNAHAWAEVYFDNVGWITFEPTPGYDGENGWSTGKSSEGEPTIYAPYGKGEPAVIEDVTDETYKKRRRGISDYSIFIVPVISVVGFLLVFLVLNRIFTRMKYKKLDYNRKMVCLTKENFRILGMLGYPVQDGETLTEYKKRIHENVKVIDTSFISDYEEFLYADFKAEYEVVYRLERTYTLLKRLLKQKKRHHFRR